VSPGQTAGAPAATVIIPTRNRADLLLQTIRSALQQTIPLELLVMDDGSTDDTARRVAAEFPAVAVHREVISRGPAWQRNRGVELSSTQVIVTLDDDCELVSPGTLARAIEQLQPPRVGAVTIPFVNVRQDNTVHSAAPNPEGIYCTAMFFGGMVAFKRAAYQEVQGYRSWYFMHVEEPDLALRLLNAGFVVRLGSGDPIHHHESPSRNSILELGPRNHILFTLQNVPMPYVLGHLPVTIFRSVAYVSKIGHPFLGLRGAIQGIAASLAHPSRRKPVAGPVYQLHRQLKRLGAVPLAEIESRLPPLRLAGGSGAS